MLIRDAADDDAGTITEIWNRYITTRAIEWTDRPHTVDGRLAWMRARQADGWPVIVAEIDGAVVGVATYADFRDSRAREGYRFTVESSIHVAESVHGQGVGRALYEELIERARAAGLHTMIAAIDGENPESVDFHAALGFTEVGRLPEVGYKFGRWLDLVLMQRML